MWRSIAAALVVGLLSSPASLRAEGFNSLLAGINGVLTAPADIVHETIEPPSLFEELPAAPVSTHFLGVFAGIFAAIDRIGWGVLDIALSPVWIAPTLSPEPVVEIIPFYEVRYDPGPLI